MHIDNETDYLDRIPTVTLVVEVSRLLFEQSPVKMCARKKDIHSVYLSYVNEIFCEISVMAFSSSSHLADEDTKRIRCYLSYVSLNMQYNRDFAVDRGVLSNCMQMFHHRLILKIAGPDRSSTVLS